MSARATDIAVIGLSGRFPGARNIEEFWRNLRDGVESLTHFSEAELDESIDREIVRHPNYVKAAPTLDDIDMFDAGFFGYSAREAAFLDPAQRMFLECAWEALESAGHAPGEFDGTVGVYAGAGSNSATYFMANLMNSDAVDFPSEGFDLVIGNDKDYLATRVSYKLNLIGQALSVQTACSTSLSAVHVACQSLLSYECDMALAGGASLRVPQRSGHVYREGMFQSADGHSRPFDARASGLTFGSGMGVVVLRRLADALADGDPVDAVIKGSALSNDGAQKVSYMSPSVDGQARAIAGALAQSGVAPETVTAIEAHGTSTPVGDPIEVAALTRVYGTSGRTGYCALGSVKSNVGHLDGAAGVTGLIKAILQAKHGELVPTLNHTEPNPEIDFAASPFVVNTALRPWETGGVPRRIGVSAFGVGGTNAHVIVEEPPAPSSAGLEQRPVQLLPVSAQSPAALADLSAGLAAALRRGELELADVAYTLAVGRRAMRHRRAVVARSPAQASDRLEKPGPVSVAAAPTVCFLFTGHGSQYVGMARGLYDEEPVFREHLDACAELLPVDLFAVLRSGDRLRETATGQPALFAVEYALARLWQSWGVEPAAMLGHSMGEITAATVAGVLALPDAARMVAVRGALMQRTGAGAMVSVPLSEERVRSLLPSSLSVAAVNAPDSCVVSGAAEAVERFRSELAAREVEVRPLPVRGAYHSALMDPILDELEAELSRLPFRDPEIPFVSNRTGDWITAAQATDPGYWRAHVRDTVRFADGVGRLLGTGDSVVLVEVGPGRTLASLARMAPGGPSATVVPSLPHRDEDRSASEFLLAAAGTVWASGVSLDWSRVHGGERRRVRLPTYPFQRQSYWIGPDRAPSVPRPREESTLVPRPDLPVGYVAPRTEWEERVAAIWQRLLGVDALGADDDLHDLGAESLLFMRVRERIKEEHGVGVPLRRLLKTGTVAELAALAAEVEAGAEEETAPAEWVGAFRLEHVPAPRSPVTVLEGAGAWSVHAPHGHPADRLRVALDEAGLGGGVLLCLPAGGEERVGLFPAAAREAASRARLVVVQEPLGAGGLARTFHLEHPSVLTTVVESCPDVASVVADVAATSTFLETRYVDGTRTVPVLRELPAGDGGGTPLSADDVVLVTGGGKGITAECALALASDSSARLALIGRADPAHDEELSATLVRMAEADIRFRYERADVTSPAAVRHAVSRCEADLGPVTAVVHGAGNNEPARIGSLTEEHFRQALAPKVTGLRNLLEAVGEIGLLVTFGSVIARLGLAGEAHYATANDWLTELTVRYGAEHPETRALAMEWSVWTGVGMAERLGAVDTRNHDGFTPITADRGVAVLRRAVADPAAGPVLAVTGRPSGPLPTARVEPLPDGAG